MPVNSVLAFWVVAALLIIVPGPDWAFTISAGLRRQVAPAAGGIVIGYTAMTTVVAAGVGLLIASSPVALTALTIIGGGYLIWVGTQTLRHPGGFGGEASAGFGGPRSTLLQGMAVSGLNPKALLLFVAMLPQFTDTHAQWPLPVQMAILGMAFTLTCAVVYICIGATAQGLLQTRPAVALVVSRVSGICMLVIGVALLVERVVVR